MLTGIPYFGSEATFDDRAEWGAVLVTSSERHRFVHIFNDVSARRDDIKEHGRYLAQFLPPDHRPGSLWKSYVDLITAMEYARREIERIPYAGGAERKYRANRGTTWLRYVTVAFAPTVPEELEGFLEDAVNRDEVIARYLEYPERWAAAVRLELPLAGSLAFLMAAEEAEWFGDARQALIKRLRDARPEEGFDEIVAWRGGLLSTPIPVRLIDHFPQFVRGDRFERQYLDLRAVRGRGIDVEEAESSDRDPA
jgi:hypothetical protein